MARPDQRMQETACVGQVPAMASISARIMKKRLATAIAATLATESTLGAASDAVTAFPHEAVPRRCRIVGAAPAAVVAPFEQTYASGYA